MTLQCFQTPLGPCEINVVDLESDESLHAAALSGDGGISNAEKRIKHGANSGNSVHLDAPFSQLNRECRRVWSFFLAALNCFIGNEPGVAATAQIASTSVRPAHNIAFVLVRDTQGKSIDFHSSRLRKVKDVLMVVVEKLFLVDWLEVTERFYRGFDPHLALDVRLSLARERIEVRAARFSFDRIRLYPVNRVLQKKAS